MTLNARFILKCAQWMARLTYVRCGFRIQPYAQVWPEGVEGEEAGGSSPTLPPCGQLTRCFSAVAELLVIQTHVTTFLSMSTTASDEMDQEARPADTYWPLISKRTCHNLQGCLQPLAKGCNLHITLIVLEAPPRWNTREYTHIGLPCISKNQSRIGPHCRANIVKIFLLRSANLFYFYKSDVSAVQGYPRSLAPINTAYATCYQSVIVIFVLSCTVSEILQVLLCS